MTSINPAVENCTNCAFSVDLPPPPGQPAIVGENYVQCRFNPPTAQMVQGGVMPIFPICNRDMVCHQYLARQSETATLTPPPPNRIITS